MNHFSSLGKMMIIIGVFFILIGLAVLFGPRIPLFGKLPGDIQIKRENFSFYFPLTTCLVISIIFTLIMHLIQKLK